MSGKPGRTFLLNLFSLFPFFLFAQTEISGKLVHESIQNLNLEGVMVHFSHNGEMEGNVYTDANGVFSFQTYQHGTFIVSINDLDFQSEEFEIEIHPNSPAKIQIEILIQNREIQLNEVLIHREKIKEKGDTIIFDAKLFAKGDERVVEDLLKRIPGLNVDEHGTISINGKEVEKVMIEGDDFFEKGYKMVTQNMPSDPIDKVEVLQRYHHNSLMKDFEESDKVALNLTLREDAKNKWFGEAELMNSFYPENHHKVYGNLISFGKKSKHFFFTNLNNLGEQEKGDLHQLYSTENYLLGDQIKNKKYYPNQNFILGLNQERYRFNNLKLGSLNSIFNLSDQIKLKPRITAKWDKLNFDTQENIRYFLGNDSIFNAIQRQSVHSTFEMKSVLDAEIELNSQSKINVSSHFSFENTDQSITENFNQVNSNQAFPNSYQTFDQKINYTNRINENNLISIHFRMINQFNQEELNAFSDENILESVFDEVSSSRLQQKINRRLNFVAADAKWIYKTSNGQLFETSINLQNTNNHLNSIFALGNDLNEIPENFQNDLRIKNLESEISAKYTHRFSNRLIWISKIGAGWGNYDFYSHDFTNDSQFFYPKIWTILNWDLASKNKLRFSFQHDSEPVQYDELFDRPLYFSPRNFRVGLNESELLPFTSLKFKYDFGEFYDPLNFGFESGFKWTEKYISTSHEIFMNYQTNQSLILKDKKDWMNVFYVSYLFENFFHYVKITGIKNFYRFENAVNSQQLRNVKSNFTSIALSINSALNQSFLNYNLGGKWNKNIYKIENIENAQENWNGFLDVNFKISNRYWLKLSQELIYLPDLSASQTYYFADVDFGHEWEKYKIGINVKLRNLTNTQTFRNIYNTDYQQTTSSYQLFPRMLLLGVSFKF